MPAHRPAAGDVLVVDRPRLAARADRRSPRWTAPPAPPRRKRAFMRSMAQNRLTAVGRVDGHHVADLLEVDRELPRPLRRALAHAERDAHRGGDANRRGAANHHRADGAGHFLRRTAPDIQFLAGQLALIDHHDRVVLPIDGGKHQGILGDNSQLPTLRLRAWMRALRRDLARASQRSCDAKRASPRETFGRCLSRSLGVAGARRSCTKQPPVERQRQQRREAVAWPVGRAQVAEDDLEVAAVFPQQLPAGSARRRRRLGVGDHGDPGEDGVALRQRLDERDALGAERQPVGGVLDVAAGDDLRRRPFRARRRP